MRKGLFGIGKAKNSGNVPDDRYSTGDRYSTDEQNKERVTRENKIIDRAILGVFITILVVLILSNNIYTLKPNEYGIIKQFGKIVRVVNIDGPHIKVPFIQNITKMPKSVMIYDVPPTEINTLDKKRIVVDYYTLWKITDPIQMLETLKTLEGAEARLSDIMYSNIRNELGKLAYGSIINAENNNRGNIDKTVQENINKILLDNLNGIEIVDIQMKRIDLPASNEQSVYKRMISERVSKAQEYLSQGDSEKNKIMANADREVAELIAKTNTEAQEIIAKGEKEAAEIYNNSYGKDPEFFKLYTTLESYKTTINNETVIMLPINSPYLKYIKGN